MMQIHEAGTNPVYWVRKKSLEGAPEAPVPSGGFVSHLYGVGYDGRPFSESLALSRFEGFREPAELGRNGGQWSALLALGDGAATAYALVTDYQGFQRAYLVDVKVDGLDYWVICHDFDTAVSLVAEFGGGGPDWEVLQPTLLANHNFMTGTWSVGRKNDPITEISPGQYLILASKGALLAERNFGNGGSLGGFDAMLESGINRAVSNLVSVVDNAPGQVLLYLSGGRDSRMVLALAVAAGVGNRLVVAPEDPYKFPSGYSRETVTRDLAVSRFLAKRYGLTLYRPSPRTDSSLTYMESLYQFQARSSGLSYEFSPQKVSPMELSPVVELRGAGGELLRSAYSGYRKTSWWRRLIVNRPDSVEEDLRSLFAVVTRSHLIPREALDAAKARFRDSLLLRGNAALDELLSLHYSFHRNRGHFGGLDYLARSGRHLVYPLSDPDLHAAAESLSFEQRRAGNVAFDLIDRTVPELNRIAFENAPSWPEMLYASRGMKAPSSDEGQVPPIDSSLAGLKNYFREVANTRAVPLSPLFSDGRQRSESFVRHSIDQLRDVFPEGMTPELAKNMLALLGRGQLDPHQSAARMASLLRFARIGAGPEREDVWLGSAPGLAVGVAVSSPSPAALEATISIERTHSRVKGELLVQGDDDLEVEFAFYLFENGVIRERVWYSPDRRFSFDSDSGAECSVMGFIRTIGSKEFILRVEGKPDS